ncbi:hypothetical protein ACP70R_009224 [Stipagrostis hirtigluma subsp. patula]
MAPSIASLGAIAQQSFKCASVVPMSSGHRGPRRVASHQQQGATAGIIASLDIHDQDMVHNKHMDNIVSLKKVILEENGRLEAMITIDSLKRLCIDYHFSEEIDVFLRSIYRDHRVFLKTKFCMFDAALTFTLPREGGYDISPAKMIENLTLLCHAAEIFQRFMNKNGEFDKSITTDMKGLLNLHDASHLNMGEDILHRAHNFTRKQLKSSLYYLEPNLADLIREAIEHPYHITLQKYKVKHHLTYIQRMFGSNQAIEELALREYYHSRMLHQFELMQFTRWWRDQGIAQELPFARNQAHKWYMWAMAILQRGPAFSKYRLEMTKVISFIYVVDDIFDVAGSPVELSLFTDAVKRWDIAEAHSLPSYMRTCYTALHNVITDMAELVEKEYGQNPIYHFRKAWENLFDAFMVETKWFAAQQLPTASDYLSNGVISSGVQVLLVHTFFLLGQGIGKDAVDLLQHNSPIITSPAKILRLWDDLGSAKDEGQCGFDGSYKDCYMNENPSCSSKAVERHMMSLISEAWQELNKDCYSKRCFSPLFQEVSMNLARMVRVMYTYDERQNLPLLEEYTNSLL